MNVKKVALFVEGMTEQVFVREFLLSWYDWDANYVGVDCYKLYNDSQSSVPYKYGSEESENYFQIFDVGNDARVLSEILYRANSLQNAGYSMIVGLRDMFSEIYTSKTIERNGERIIDSGLNDRFIQGAKDTIIKEAKNIDIHIQFAIMEVEAWLLGMPKFFERLSGVNDPETDIYHPAVALKELRKVDGYTYQKHRDEIQAIMGSITKDDYKALIDSGRCQSFRKFAEVLLSTI